MESTETAPESASDSAPTPSKTSRLRPGSPEVGSDRADRHDAEHQSLLEPTLIDAARSTSIAEPKAGEHDSLDGSERVPQLGDDRQLALLQLAMLPGIGPRTLTAILERFGSPDAALRASASELTSIPGVGVKLVHMIRSAADHVAATSIAEWCRSNAVAIVSRGDAGYPLRLEELASPPAMLFVRGGMIKADELAVAIVGTRHATPYGIRQAERFAYGLSKAGVTIISGLARGIDAAAHRGAVDAGGRTIAVLGSGLARIYPPEHEKLAGTIAESGAVISEYAPETQPRGGLFPQRNRLIAGLTLATLVVEAPDRSGSLITARLAGEQGRDVLALPGPVTSRASRGCNALIRDGAQLVQSVEDVLDSIGPVGTPVTSAEGQTVRSGAELNLNDLEKRVLEAIGAPSTSLDRVIEICQLPAHRVQATISVLEIRKLVRRLSSQYVARV